jgi:hypothetical protein
VKTPLVEIPIRARAEFYGGPACKDALTDIVPGAATRSVLQDHSQGRYLGKTHSCGLDTPRPYRCQVKSDTPETTGSERDSAEAGELE